MEMQMVNEYRCILSYYAKTRLLGGAGYNRANERVSVCALEITTIETSDKVKGVRSATSGGHVGEEGCNGTFTSDR